MINNVIDYELCTSTLARLKVLDGLLSDLSKNIDNDKDHLRFQDSKHLIAEFILAYENEILTTAYPDFWENEGN